jgi:hypothetical protein
VSLRIKGEDISFSSILLIMGKMDCTWALIDMSQAESKMDIKCKSGQFRLVSLF